MVKLRQILRLYAQGKSKHKISEQTGTASNTLKKYLKEFKESGLSFQEVNDLSDKDLEERFVRQER